MKKLLFLIIIFLFSIQVEAGKFHKSTQPFAPAKHHKASTKKCKKTKRSKQFFACGTSPKKVNRHGLMH